MYASGADGGAEGQERHRCGKGAVACLGEVALLVCFNRFLHICRLRGILRLLLRGGNHVGNRRNREIACRALVAVAVNGVQGCALVDLEAMGAGLGRLVHQHLAVRKDNRFSGHRGLIECEDELLVLPCRVLEGETIGAVRTLAKAIRGLVNLFGHKVLARNIQADLTGIVHKVKVVANKILDGRAGGNLVHELGLELIEVGIEFAFVRVPARYSKKVEPSVKSVPFFTL